MARGDGNGAVDACCGGGEIKGQFLGSLATGLGGKSAVWGPVAASMVFGLFVGTILTLFLIPVLFRIFIRLRDHRVRDAVKGFCRRYMPAEKI